MIHTLDFFSRPIVVAPLLAIAVFATAGCSGDPSASNSAAADQPFSKEERAAAKKEGWAGVP